MFDTLTYEKGGSVLRMLEQYLGAEVFRNGVRRYLQTHAYGNTVTADLWNALEEVSGEPVRAMADSWILQGGHPLVTVGESSIGQQPFAYLAEPPLGESAIGRHWLVPLLVRSRRRRRAHRQRRSRARGRRCGRRGRRCPAAPPRGGPA